MGGNMRNADSAVVSTLAPSGFPADAENLAPGPAGMIVHRRLLRSCSKCFVFTIWAVVGNLAVYGPQQAVLYLRGASALDGVAGYVWISSSHVRCDVHTR